MVISVFAETFKNDEFLMIYFFIFWIFFLFGVLCWGHLGCFKYPRNMYKTYLLTRLLLLTWMLPDLFNGVYFVYYSYQLRFLLLIAVKYYFFNIHIFNVLNVKIGKEAKDIHVNKINQVKNVSGGDAHFASKNAIYDIGTEILNFQCFCIMEMFLFSKSIIPEEIKTLGPIL